MFIKKCALAFTIAFTVGVAFMAPTAKATVIVEDFAAGVHTNRGHRYSTPTLIADIGPLAIWGGTLGTGTGQAIVPRKIVMINGNPTAVRGGNSYSFELSLLNDFKATEMMLEWGFGRNSDVSIDLYVDNILENNTTYSGLTAQSIITSSYIGAATTVFRFDVTCGLNGQSECGNAGLLLATFSNEITSVPEPAPLALLGLGLIGIGVIRRRKVRS